MSAPLQQTVAGGSSLEGVGLHTGEAVRLRFVAAEPDTGIRFRRTDLVDRPEVAARLEHVASTDRGTAIGIGDVRVQTVEHVLAALAACGIDNVVVEIDGPEVPIADGSFEPFFELLRGCGAAVQDRPAREFTVEGPITAGMPGGASYVALPCPTFRVSASIAFDHPLVRRQYASFDVTVDDFGAEIARARTFGFLKEAEALRARGLALGATLENAIVLNETGIESGELRYRDEFVRHKIGDVVGDLALLGGRLRGHVIADRPSHAGNLELARGIEAAARARSEPIVDITRIMQYLPHRYPMLLVDRVVEFEQGKRIVGIKNVTINEPFFQGHYPGHPIMPGVLIIEAMAQVGGLLLMDAIDNPEDKVVYFMSLDNVKWRRPVIPGDQIRFELEMLQFRRHVCRMKGVGRVDGQIVAEAEMMARIVER